jgi:hypothetical protein
MGVVLLAWDPYDQIQVVLHTEPLSQNKRMLGYLF